MSEDQEIFTIREVSKGIFKDRGSRFLAFAFPVKEEDEIRMILKDLRKEYHDARHHCYAFRLGIDNFYFRSNDDGEPSGTAGKPILGQLVSKKLSNILLVVVRYFGGKLLGTSGLINAYRMAAADCLSNSKTEALKEIVNAEICFPYEQMSSVMRIINETSFKIMHQDFQTSCYIQVSGDRKNYELAVHRFTVLKDVTITTL